MTSNRNINTNFARKISPSPFGTALQETKRPLFGGREFKSSACTLEKEEVTLLETNTKEATHEIVDKVNLMAPHNLTKSNNDWGTQVNPMAKTFGLSPWMGPWEAKQPFNDADIQAKTRTDAIVEKPINDATHDSFDKFNIIHRKSDLVDASEAIREKNSQANNDDEQERNFHVESQEQEASETAKASGGFIMDKNTTANANGTRLQKKSKEEIIDSKEHVKHWERKALHHFKNSSWKDVIHACKKVLQVPGQSTTNCDVLYQAGHAYKILEEFETAAKYLMGAYRIDSQRIHIRIAIRDLKTRIITKKTRR